MNKLVCSAILVTLAALTSFADAGTVRRYTGKSNTGLVSDSLRPADDMVVEFVVDMWEGDSENILIGAGIKMSAHQRAGHSRSESFTSFRRVSTPDVKNFGTIDQDFVITFQRGDDPNRRVNLVYLALTKTFSVEFREFKRWVNFSEKDMKVAAIPEQVFSPLNLSGAPLVFESNNLPVPFQTFFENKNTGFNFDIAQEAVEPPTEIITVPVAQQPKAEEKKSLDRYVSPPGASFGSGSFSSWSKGSYAPAKPKAFGVEGFDRKLKALIDLDTKPTIVDILDFMSAVRRKDPNYNLEKNPFSDFMSGFRNDVAQSMRKMDDVREQLEIAFPGAIWYILGRDAYLYGDALEASYLAKGETGRVVRLPASAPSFQGAELETVDGFLKTNGINVDDVGPESVPRIILDISSYSASEWRLSQSRHLMRAAYDRWKSLGRDPRDLARKVNFVNISGMHDRYAYRDQKDVQEFISLLDYVPEPSAVLTSEGPDRFLYTIAWHGLYRPFVTNPDGSVVSPHDAPSDRSTKMEMLGELWDVVAFYGPEKMIKSARALKCQKTMSQGVAKR